MLDVISTATLFAGAAMACVMVVAGYKSQRKVAADLARAEQLRLGNELLEVQQTHLEAVFASAEVPDDLKTRLLRIVDVFENRDAMLHLTEALREEALGHDLPRRSDLAARLDDLPPRIRDAFIGTVVTGLLGTVLRWPETASCYQALAAAALKGPAEVFRSTAEASTQFVSKPVSAERRPIRQQLAPA